MFTLLIAVQVGLILTWQAVEKFRQLISPWSPEQQQSIEILVDEISFASAAVNSLVIRPGSFTAFNYSQFYLDYASV